MLPEHIEEKLSWFIQDTYEIVNGKGIVHIIEKKKNGEADIECQINGDAIVIANPEDKVLPYLIQDKGIRSCADSFILKMIDDKNCELHITELKKTVKVGEFRHAINQLEKGIYNARAIAGFLGINISNINVYLGFRNDEIQTIDDNKWIEFRSNNNAEDLKLITCWKKDICPIVIDGIATKKKQNKIELDDQGNGSMII